VTPKRIQKNPKRFTKGLSTKEKSKFSKSKTNPWPMIKHVHPHSNFKTI
jgi:hypothetical protein